MSTDARTVHAVQFPLRPLPHCPHFTTITTNNNTAAVTSVSCLSACLSSTSLSLAHGACLLALCIVHVPDAVGVDYLKFDGCKSQQRSYPAMYVRRDVVGWISSHEACWLTARAPHDGVVVVKALLLVSQQPTSTNQPVSQAHPTSPSAQLLGSPPTDL